MESIRKIWAVSWYEVKSLLRSNIFRVYSVSALFFLFISTSLAWKAIPSSIPYIMAKNFIVIQTVFGALLAIELWINDLRLHSTETLYVRSITNAGYVTGKVLGIIFVFLMSNTVYMTAGFVVTLTFFSEASVIPITFLYYPLLLSLPAIVFIIGLSLLVTSILKSKALSTVLLMGFILCTLFFIGNKFFDVFDFLGLHIPFLYSDFVGFGNIHRLVLQRSFYLFFGVCCIFITVFLLPRLSQSRFSQRISFVAALLCFVSISLAGTNYLMGFYDESESRQHMSDLNKKYADTPRVSVTGCNLDLVHLGKEIEVKATVHFTNKNNTSLDTYIFSLNPGLEVLEVTGDGQNVDFKRDTYILTIRPAGNNLKPGSSDSLLIHYRGNIDEQACYLSIDENERREHNRLFFYVIDKRYSFVTPQYVLLTRENLWYPSPGIPSGSVVSESLNKDFIDFRLTVTANEDLTPISQGNPEKIGEGKHLFIPETPLPQLSLVIGDYVKKSVTVDDIEFAVFVKSGHDYFSPHFTHISNKLESTIRRCKQEFESRINMDYPFRRFFLIEVPVQYLAYQRTLSLSPETIQPEQIFVPEKGVYLSYGNLERLRRLVVSHPHYRTEVSTPEDIESAALHFFARENFLEISRQRVLLRFWKQEVSSSDFSMAKIGFSAFPYPYFEYNYTVFPLYYCFTNNFTTDQYELFDVLIGYYLISKVVHQTVGRMNNKRLIPDKVIVTKNLSHRSLQEIAANCKDKYIINAVFTAKAEYFVRYMCQKIGIDQDTFDSFLTEFLQQNKFSTVGTKVFLNSVKDRFGTDIQPYIDQWFNQKELPRYEVFDIKYTEFYSKGKKHYQVYFTIQNLSSVDGNVYAFMDNRGIIGERSISINGNETKQIGMVVDREPIYGIRIDPLLSQHYTYIDNFLDKYKTKQNVEIFDGERVIKNPAKSDNRSIIVDNLDSGFVILSQPQKGFLTKFLSKKGIEKKDEFDTFNMRIPPDSWQYGFDELFYGNPEPSTHYIKSGKGKCRVQWNAEITDNGTYDIFYYTPPYEEFRIPNPKKIYACEDFSFMIYYDGGIDEVTLDMSNTGKAWKNSGSYETKGWTYIGTYYLSKGTATVELTDESKGKLVYADAVKWVKK